MVFFVYFFSYILFHILIHTHTFLVLNLTPIITDVLYGRIQQTCMCVLHNLDMFVHIYDNMIIHEFFEYIFFPIQLCISMISFYGLMGLLHWIYFNCTSSILRSKILRTREDLSCRKFFISNLILSFLNFRIRFYIAISRSLPIVMQKLYKKLYVKLSLEYVVRYKKSDFF